MGRGSYTASDWLRLSNSRGFSSAGSATVIFRKSAPNPGMDCRFIRTRCARDSLEHPNSTPVILGFDVTASMGFLAEEIAKNGLNAAIMSILSLKPITDPQILCAAIGDCRSDNSPIQVTQFESDIRIVQQLLELHLEGGGGGNGGESYNLLWHFAAQHTAIDSMEKRGQKGFLFTIGDDKCHSGLFPAEIHRVFGDRVTYSRSNEVLIQEAGKRYHIFHIHLDRGQEGDEIFSDWQHWLPGRVARLRIQDVGLIADLIVSLIRIVSGESTNSILKSLDQRTAERLAPALAPIRLVRNSETITF
ncbi:MAG: hypothetical protein IJV82_06645 [Oscillospiraceae bacterium]|nr:hypothetical protein [Oscillospiraceae bacterium]